MHYNKGIYFFSLFVYWLNQVRIKKIAWSGIHMQTETHNVSFSSSSVYSVLSKIPITVNIPWNFPSALHNTEKTNEFVSHSRNEDL